MEPEKKFEKKMTIKITISKQGTPIVQTEMTPALRTTDLMLITYSLEEIRAELRKVIAGHTWKISGIKPKGGEKGEDKHPTQ